MSNFSKDKKLNIFVIGTRAQLIKVAPVIYECEKQNKNLLMLMTGQHKDTMSDITQEFNLKTEQVFAVESVERATIFSLVFWLPRAILGVLKKLKNIRANVDNTNINILVHGDTLTTFISAYCAKILQMKVIHLESGLTSHKLFSPFPEELIRRLVFKVTDVAYCPDTISTMHMKKISNAQVVNTNGNTIFDAVDLITKYNETIKTSQNYIVFSIHRFQNIYHKKRLNEIVNLIIELSEIMEVQFILHPTTKKKLLATGLIKILKQINNVQLKDRMSYSDFIRLVNSAACIFTDGGSNQEELAYLGIPTVIMRDATERIDGLGENAIMEADIKSVVDFVGNKKYERLRKENKKLKNSGVAKCIVESL